MSARWWSPLAVAIVGMVAALVLVACGGADNNGGTAPDTESPAGGGVTIQDAWVRETTNDVAAAYLVIKNAGGTADRLLSAASNVSPTAQIHETLTEGGSMRMQEVARPLAVPANGVLELKPGGYHIMLLNLSQPLKAGETVRLELRLEHAGTLQVDAPVKSSQQMSRHDGMSSMTAANHD